MPGEPPRVQPSRKKSWADLPVALPPRSPRLRTFLADADQGGIELGGKRLLPGLLRNVLFRLLRLRPFTIGFDSEEA